MPEDIKKKIQDTLGDYGIILNEQNAINSNLNEQNAFNSNLNEQNALHVSAVLSSVKYVKDLSPDIVNTELESFKKTSPSGEPRRCILSLLR